MRKFANNSGFGLLQVMVAAVVLGIFAMVFVRKGQNRADVSLLTELITYRDQVLDYYAAVVQSRTAWQCTRRCNSTPTTTQVGFVLYDGDGDCQSGCPTGTTPTKRLPSEGWRFSMKDNSSVFIPTAWARSATPSQTSTIADTHPFHVQAKWEKASSTTNSVKVTISIDFLPSDEWKKENTTLDIGGRQRVFYMNRTPYKNCADGLAAKFVGSTFYDDGGTGIGVARYAGDTVVVAVDAVTGLVKCWNSPLVIPPCYRYNQFPFNSASTHDNANTLDFVAASNCSYTDKGLCPKVGSGTTGITHFDNFTGISHCGREHILMVERSGVSGIDCGASGNGGLVGISASGNFICSNDSGVGGGTGVEHNEGTAYDAGIRGWDTGGNIVAANYPHSNSTPREHNRVYVPQDINRESGYYWTGDKGDPGESGTSILCYNCCTYPQLRADSWPSGCCQERYEDCNLSQYASPTCIVCDAAVATCEACKQEFERECHTPCATCTSGHDNCMSTCRTCRSNKDDCEKPCRDCRRNCSENCSSCVSTNCSSASDKDACEDTYCTNDCDDCRPACDASSDCTKDCGDCDDECRNESTCTTDWNNANCDTKCTDCISSTRMSSGCRSYDSLNGKCHEGSVINPACNSCKECRKDRDDCNSLESALRGARDTPNDPNHCEDVL